LERVLKQLCRDGYARLSVSAIAGELGISKPTIYLRWPSKAALAQAALAVPGKYHPIVAGPSGDTAADLIAYLTQLHRTFAATGVGLTGGLWAAEAQNPELTRSYRRHFVFPTRQSLRAILEAAVAAGELPVTASLDAGVHMLVGALYAAHIADQQGDLDVPAIVGIVLGGLSARGSSTPPAASTPMPPAAETGAEAAGLTAREASRNLESPGRGAPVAMVALAGPGSRAQPATGRPRSDIAGRVLGAVLRRLARDGYLRMSVSAIAAEVNVSKPSIYLRWPSKATLAAAAVATLRQPVATPDWLSGDAQGDLLHYMTALRGYFVAMGLGLSGALWSEEHENPALIGTYRDVVVRPSREILRAILEQGRAQGRFRTDLPVAPAVHLLAGAVYGACIAAEEPLLDLPAVVGTVLMGLGAQP
ncbi:MAG: TetR/AcrR family transcriptional regulator C-terminal ligand-binding domain-containing protein, partial [Chloroflexota bacterium]